MKKILAIICLAALLLAVFGCSQSVTNPGGREYTYEKVGYGSQFVITLNEDGTFVYVEGWMGDYTGVGTWTMEDNVVIMQDDKLYGSSAVNRFLFDGQNLIFQAKGSDNFFYVSVLDGEMFKGQPIGADKK